MKVQVPHGPHSYTTAVTCSTQVKQETCIKINVSISMYSLCNVVIIVQCINGVVGACQPFSG